MRRIIVNRTKRHCVAPRPIILTGIAYPTSPPILYAVAVSPSRTVKRP
jgi:hypothetical protein